MTMALITCQECSTRLSDTANSCPECGASMQTAKGRAGLSFNGKLLLAVAIFVIVVWAFR
ncbi:zinc-ribbon domain-containing protein [Lysobacter sp. F6437]|uniref:zinc-ribbon domain-containing protein n=1 Tax=Lysobacter sp. F6437 TaxID=3459296 RepID=UPI00403D57FF